MIDHNSKSDSIISSVTVQLIHSTALRPGAIAIIQLIGPSGPLLRALTGVEHWPLRTLRLVDFSGIDSGLAVRLSDDVAQLMPHGGVRVVQRLTAKLVELGASSSADDHDIHPLQLFPEAADIQEAIMLEALSRAQSPLAVDLLLDQPRRWRSFLDSQEELSPEDVRRSIRLNRLIKPPLVVLAGRPNVGKSTLSNALIGRALSISYDMPGTTRDYTAGRIDLGGLVVDWHDTPGLRVTSDPIEHRAIELAHRLIMRADLLVAMRDPETEWPDLPREADVRIVNKIDGSSQTHDQTALQISARTGKGLAELVVAVQDALVAPLDLHNPRPWIFDQRLTNESATLPQV